MGIRKLSEIFFKNKPLQAILCLFEANEDYYVLNLSKKINATYAYTLKLLKEFESEGLIYFEKKGNRKHILLTDKGSFLGKKLLEVIKRK